MSDKKIKTIFVNNDPKDRFNNTLRVNDIYNNTIYDPEVTKNSKLLKISNSDKKNN